MKIVAAFYHYKTPITDWQSFKKRLTHELICFFTHSRFSHVELAITYGVPNADLPLYTCYGASARDGGVRRKAMLLPADKWTLVPVYADDNAIRHFFEQQQGKKYDWLADCRAIVPFLSLNLKTRWMCAEFVASALNLPTSSGFSPATLYCHLTGAAHA